MEENLASGLDKCVSIIENLIETKKRFAQNTYSFVPFLISNHSFKIAAVDGSNHLREGVNFSIAALRAGSIIYQSGKLLEKNISEILPEILLESENNHEASYDRVYKKYYYSLTNEPPLKEIEYGVAPEYLRTLLEWKEVSNLVENLGFGDLIMIDGSLISGIMGTNHLFYQNLIKKAKVKGISLIGISKDSGVSKDGVSIPAILSEAEKYQGVSSNWYIKIEDKCFVKFTKKANVIFRLDMMLPDGFSMEEALSKVGAYACSTKTVGYPFPLLRIHDAVVISKDDIDKIMVKLKHQWITKRRPGDSREYHKILSDFEDLFSNYHRQLDILSSGR